MFPITEAVAEEYQISKRGKVHVTVGIAGTGGGFKIENRSAQRPGPSTAEPPRPAAPRRTS